MCKIKSKLTISELKVSVWQIPAIPKFRPPGRRSLFVGRELTINKASLETRHKARAACGLARSKVWSRQSFMQRSAISKASQPPAPKAAVLCVCMRAATHKSNRHALSWIIQMIIQQWCGGDVPARPNPQCVVSIRKACCLHSHVPRRKAPGKLTMRSSLSLAHACTCIYVGAHGRTNLLFHFNWSPPLLRRAWAALSSWPGPFRPITIPSVRQNSRFWGW